LLRGAFFRHIVRMSQITRRHFIKKSALGIGAFTSTYSLNASAQIEGANTDLRVAVIGCGGKGSSHIGELLGMKKGVRIEAVCDPDDSYLAKHADRIGAQQGSKPKIYKDYRLLCEDKDIDAVMIATPNHLHTTIAIRAAQSGKHVYVEKPVSHNIWEGTKLVEAAEKYGKQGIIIQHGMQRRSDTGWYDAMAFLNDKDCPIGKMTLSRGLCYKARNSIGKVDKPQLPPPGIDYDLWSGPREILPIMRQRFHYDWHWQWPYGNGDTGNQGPHQMDVARWATGQEVLPSSVISAGGRFGYDDDGTTPNTHIMFFDYKPVPVIFETRGLPAKGMEWGKGMPSFMQGQVGNVIHCEGGHVTESKAYDKDGKSIKKFALTGGGSHLSNWLKSIREGKQDPRLSAKTGHLSAALCHMGNTSLRLGKQMKVGEYAESIKDNAAYGETFERMLEHLTANKVDTKMTLPTAGVHLKMNTATERYEGDLATEANAMDKESYRQGFEVPEQV
jgi:predicted dehydrogenase